MVTRWHHCTLAGGGGDEVTSPPRDSCRYYCMYVRSMYMYDSISIRGIITPSALSFFSSILSEFWALAPPPPQSPTHGIPKPIERTTALSNPRPASRRPANSATRTIRLARLQVSCLISSLAKQTKKKKKQAKRKTQGRKCVFWSGESLSML